MTHTEELARRWSAVMMSNYKVPPVALDHGAGATVWDVDGVDYTDLLGGIATTSWATRTRRWSRRSPRRRRRSGTSPTSRCTSPAVRSPSGCSRSPAARTRLLLQLRGRGQRGRVQDQPADRPAEVITAEGSFHGRTMGALALTGQPAKADAFAPLPGVVRYVPYGDVAALAGRSTERTAMVLLEPMLGEGGVVPAPAGYLAAARRAPRPTRARCSSLDEVQTGIGRTGTWFAHQADGLRPDLVTLAKALGGGLPIGALLAFGEPPTC